MTRAAETELIELVKSALHHEETAVCIEAEHAFLARVEGGCNIPVGAYAELQGSELKLSASIASLDGKKMLREVISGPANTAANLGHELAAKMMSSGGQVILDQIRATNG